MATGLYVTATFKPLIGGGHEYTHQMAKNLTELGESITVLTPSCPGDTEFDKELDYHVVRFDTDIGKGGGWKHPVARGLLLKEIIKNSQDIRADYLIYDGYSFLYNISIILASNWIRKPLFVISHHIAGLNEPPLLSKLVRNFTLRQASVNICVSKFTSRELLDRGVNSSKIFIIHNGLDFEEIRTYNEEFPHLDSTFPSGSPTVLTVSRLVESKGIQSIIKAMPKIVSELPEAKYIIVGDGNYKEHLTRLADRSSVRDSITFLGSLTDKEKFMCYGKCDVFALASEFEGFGIVFLEANAVGKPVVGGRIGGVPEAVIHGETGLLVDPKDTDAIADAIIFLFKNPNEAHRLGRNGRHRVLNEFDWKVSARKLFSVIHHELGRRK